MSIVLDHTIVPASDNEASARFFARISGLDEIDVVVMDDTTAAVAEWCEGHGIELVAANG